MFRYVWLLTRVGGLRRVLGHNCTVLVKDVCLIHSLRFVSAGIV